jgi:hypothetical protein
MTVLLSNVPYWTPSIRERDTAMGTTVRCECGREHGDGARLAKIGWRPLGEGRARLVAACPCGGVVTLSTIDDASFCVVCRRIVHREPKIVAEGSGVLCVACARRTKHAVRLPRCPQTATERGLGRDKRR